MFSGNNQCGPSNPLQRMTKVGNNDKSIQQDVFQGHQSRVSLYKPLF